MLNAGSHTLTTTFTPTDAVNYTTATATVTLVVSQATPVITWATPAGIAYGTALSATQLNATTPVAGTFAYSSPLGTVLNAGSHTLTATFTPTDAVNYATATSTVTLVVTQATPVITWATPAGISYGTALSATQLNATTLVAGTFAYSSPLGTVLNAGSHTLTATFTPTDAVNYTTATATATLVVTQATPVITWPTPAGISYGTALSATQLNATTPVAGTFVYAPALGAVLNAGTGHTLSVTFTPTDATNYTTATATVLIDVAKATPAITWATPAGITYGTALGATQLNASSPVQGTFVYTPALGVMLGAGAGQTLSVTFTPTDGANYTTATASVLIAVSKATPAITWATPAGITYGTALTATQLNATSPVPGTFAYTPALGAVLGAGAGQTLSVTFTPTDAANYTTATASVLIAVSKATPAITWATPAGITYGTVLSATQLNATSPVQGTFVYTPALGAVLSTGAGQTLSVAFTPTDTANYTTATATVLIDVAKATPAITWATPVAIPYGTALSGTQLNATTPVAGTFAYSSPLGTVLTAGSHTLTATFTPTDAVNYTTATATVALVVTQATPIITWATPAGITYGAALTATQLNATTPLPGTLDYTPALGAVLNAGAGQTLSVTFTPTDSANYRAATATVLIDVAKVTPVITWATPAGIAFGTALTATQLNATTPVAGTFVYTPPAGTILPAGAGQLLSATFTPTDATDFSSVTQTVTIDVIGIAPDDHPDWQPHDGDRDADRARGDGDRPARESASVRGNRAAARRVDRFPQRRDLRDADGFGDIFRDGHGRGHGAVRPGLAHVHVDGDRRVDRSRAVHPGKLPDRIGAVAERVRDLPVGAALRRSQRCRHRLAGLVECPCGVGCRQPGECLSPRHRAVDRAGHRHAGGVLRQQHRPGGRGRECGFRDVLVTCRPARPARCRIPGHRTLERRRRRRRRVRDGYRRQLGPGADVVGQGPAAGSFVHAGSHRGSRIGLHASADDARRQPGGGHDGGDDGGPQRIGAVVRADGLDHPDGRVPRLERPADDDGDRRRHDQREHGERAGQLHHWRRGDAAVRADGERDIVEHTRWCRTATLRWAGPAPVARSR